MESTFESNQNIHVKTEKNDDFEYQSDNNSFRNVGILTAVKEEKLDSDESNVVASEHYPWQLDSLQHNQINSAILHTPYEYDDSPTIKTEIEIGESKLEQPIEDFIQPNECSKNEKRKKSRLNKSRELKPKNYQCQFCGKECAHEEGMARHTIFHPTELPFQCRVCMTRFTDGVQMHKHEKSCDKQRFECYLCRFTSLHWRWNRFLVHFRKQTGDMPFQCKCCTKRFSSKRMLNFHMKYHPKAVQTKCSFCQRPFASSDLAKNHELQCAVHRKWECFLCKSTFTYRSSLLRHFPQHTGQFKFKCKYCSNAYARKDYSEIHQRSHNAELLKFECSQCKQGFLQEAELNAHVSMCTKKMYKCDLCDFTTKSKAYAEDHKQKHIGSDEFKCLRCSEVFLQRSQLLKHVKIHNKKVPFNCPNCRKVYHRWIILEKHRRKCSKTPSSSN